MHSKVISAVIVTVADNVLTIRAQLEEPSPLKLDILSFTKVLTR